VAFEPHRVKIVIDRPARRPGFVPAVFAISIAIVIVMGVVVAGSGLIGLPNAGATGATPPPPPLPRAATIVSGPLVAPGGPFLYDDRGRVVFLHGVNVVYKHPPYEVYPDRHKPWNFDAATASRIAGLGFDVVRLGMTWAGLEPGTDPANDPAICTRGTPENPHQYDATILYRYLDRLKKTVALLGRYHIYTLLDMHQDVYSTMFDGEGAPNWAVCTDGVKSVDPPGRWSLEYGTRAAGIAFHHFWTNNVVGDLQGQFDMVWGKVASFFRNDPSVIGFDPFNEPFSTSVLRVGGQHFDGQLECFYTGTAHVGGTLDGAPPIRCPTHDPATGVIPMLESNDPGALIFDEPDLYAGRGFPTYLGPMDFKSLVYNIHVYCGDRNPFTGNPIDVTRCVRQEAKSLALRRADRPMMATPAQPAGPAWLVTEFGASSTPGFLARVTASFDHDLVGWIYWAWKYYDDPTGSGSEALLRTDGRLRPTARVLSETYAQAVAGTPLVMTFDPTTGLFHLRYRPDHRLRAPTVVFVATAEHYAHGYCATASGGRIESTPGSTHLVVANDRRSRIVSVTVTSGRCRR